MNAYNRLFEEKKMPLIMSLPKNDPEWCAAGFEAGADAVKVHINLHHNAGGEDLGGFAENENAFETMLSKAKGPMGIVPGADAQAIQKDIDRVKISGFDFISFYSKHLPVSVLPCSQALMAACDLHFTYEEIKAYEHVGAQVLEASVIPSDEYGQPLNFRDLALYRSIAVNTKLPVVIPTQRFIEPGDVKYLAAAGVRGIMIGAVVTGKTCGGIVSAVKAFRKAIDEL